jgi:hypothetical protein
MQLSILSKLILLFAGHALCDYPLQGDFLARGKNHRQPLLGIPWWQCLTAHALIHAGMVFLITQSTTFAALEFVVHFWTDYAKCDGKLTFNQDQAVHYAFKVLWAVL